MAPLNITLNQEEILQLLSNDKSEAFAKLLQESLNGILKAESTAQLQAEPYERTSERKFLKSLKLRGLSEVYMITSDAHEGIIDAVAKQFP